ncbi:hypothetical protein [Streptosporangium sp. NPDC000509]|uniref:hypothetical protein n=1 Tax=Streptosporangium sp. NPDC000509 TaxID=3366186 RepID=UPI0036A9FBCC
MRERPSLFVLLAQGERLARIGKLAHGDLAPGMHEVSAADCSAAAAIRLSYVNG